jgi:Uncharacterised protein conserved in bacteria (DUF2336)
MTKPPQTLAELENLLDPGSEIDMRTTLLRVLTHLYLQRPTHPPEDEHYYTELALRLIDAADLPERVALAAQLAPYPSAPQAVIARLARDVIEVAAPILKHSPCLTAGDLEAIAARHGAAHAAAISARSLPAAPTAQGPASDDPAQALACQLSELFYAAGAPERRLILINLDYALAIPSPRLAAAQRADVWRLESAALQHNTETLVGELGRMLGVSRTQARRIVNDEMGEPIVVAAKALELPAETLRRVLLFMTPWAGQSVDRVYELAELYTAISVALTCNRMSASAAANDRNVFRPHATIWSRKCRPARSSISTIHTSGSKRISRARRSSTLASGAGSSPRHRVKSRSAGRASSKTLCGAGPNNSAVPSSRLSLTNMAPASSAPRRRTAANAPSIWQRRI